MSGPPAPDARDGRRDEWLAIEAEARAQVKSDLDRLEATPLEFGAFICWSESLLGRTNGFTPVHQVGFPQIGRAFTTCGAMIPPPGVWLPLSPAMVRTMDRCKYCEAETTRIAKGRAA